MEHEILVGEQLLDYVAERITLQDSLESVLRLLALHSLVNGGLKEKEFNTVRKELIPVIMLSARDSEEDKVAGLEIGADDYVTKPFQKGELAARVKSQLRRYQRFGAQDPAEKSDEIRLENLYIEKNTHSVKA